jgi:hypothetical protein
MSGPQNDDRLICLMPPRSKNGRRNALVTMNRGLCPTLCWMTCTRDEANGAIA